MHSLRHVCVIDHVHGDRHALLHPQQRPGRDAVIPDGADNAIRRQFDRDRPDLQREIGFRHIRRAAGRQNGLHLHLLAHQPSAYGRRAGNPEKVASLHGEVLHGEMLKTSLVLCYPCGALNRPPFAFTNESDDEPSGGCLAATSQSCHDGLCLGNFWHTAGTLGRRGVDGLHMVVHNDRMDMVPLAPVVLTDEEMQECADMLRAILPKKNDSGSWFIKEGLLGSFKDSIVALCMMGRAERFLDLAGCGSLSVPLLSPWIREDEDYRLSQAEYKNKACEAAAKHAPFSRYLSTFLILPAFFSRLANPKRRGCFLRNF